MVLTKTVFWPAAWWSKCKTPSWRTNLNQHVANEIVFQPLHPDTGDERIIAFSSTCETLLMERGQTGKFLFCGFEDFLEVSTVMKKIENTMLRFKGCPFKCLQGRWPRSAVAGVLNVFRQSGAHAPYFPVTDSDKYIEMKLSSLTHCAFTLKRKSGRLLFVMSWWKKCRNVCVIILPRHFLEIEVYKGMCEADSDCTHASVILKRRIW